MEIRIPKIGTAVTEAELVEWLVADGDTIDEGTPLYTLATDKVENEIEAPTGGTVHLLAEAAETYPVGHVIARIEG